MRRALAISMLMTVAVLPRPSVAAGAGVSIYNNSFSPVPAEATTGETVTWTWTCGDGYYGGNCVTHNVTAYEGASFASGDKTAQGSTFSHTLTSANTIRYRCTKHSSLSGSVCQGMCGAIVRDIQRPSVRIFRPASPLVTIGAPVAPVVFAGDVKDNRETVDLWLRIERLLGTATTTPISCPSCPMTGQRAWEQSIALEPGHYTITANARDGAGLEGRSEPITVIVL